MSTVPAEIYGWFAGRLPQDWFEGGPTIQGDEEEIWVIGAVSPPEVEGDPGPEAVAAARTARAQRFRSDTRHQRVRVAQEAERRFGRRVAWGVTVEGERYMFTRRSVPVMTRLQLPERQVLDTLVDAGVARSRSEALAWCVHLVGKHQGEWIDELRSALTKVEELRRKGPGQDQERAPGERRG
jgi:GTP1/Obg family GTP-binding protein